MKAHLVIWSAGSWLSLRALDIATTWLCAQRGYFETNPWARNSDGTFNLAHGAGVSAFWFAALAYIGMALWLTFRAWNKQAAVVIAVAPAWILGISIVLPAIVHNFMTWLGWYHGG